MLVKYIVDAYMYIHVYVYMYIYNVLVHVHPHQICFFYVHVHVDTVCHLLGGPVPSKLSGLMYCKHGIWDNVECRVMYLEDIHTRKSSAMSVHVLFTTPGDLDGVQFGDKSEGLPSLTLSLSQLLIILFLPSILGLISNSDSLFDHVTAHSITCTAYGFAKASILSVCQWPKISPQCLFD